MKNRENKFSLSTERFIKSLDWFIENGEARENIPMPALISIPLFNSRGLSRRVANRAAYPLLRIVRKATSHYYHYQLQTNLDLQEQIKSLQKEVSFIKSMLEKNNEREK